MPVIITNGFGGLFFHEACGHSLEASGVAKGNSEFSGKLGQKVASDKLTLIDDGSIPGQWGSLKVDDEGVPTQKNVLIENGILKGYMVDKLNARRMGCAPTGSSRRQSFRFAPTSRMTNTYIAPGESTPEEMIAATERGIFVNSINAGSVNPATGEFNFNTSETFLNRKWKDHHTGTQCNPDRYWRRYSAEGGHGRKRLRTGTGLLLCSKRCALYRSRSADRPCN